jgi:hypothetical protein
MALVVHVRRSRQRHPCRLQGLVVDQPAIDAPEAVGPHQVRRTVRADAGRFLIRRHPGRARPRAGLVAAQVVLQGTGRQTHGKGRGGQRGITHIFPAVVGRTQGAREVHGRGPRRQTLALGAAGAEHGKVGLIRVADDPVAADAIVGDHVDQVRHTTQVGHLQKELQRIREPGHAAHGRTVAHRGDGLLGDARHRVAVEQGRHVPLLHVPRPEHGGEIHVPDPAAVKEIARGIERGIGACRGIEIAHRVMPRERHHGGQRRGDAARGRPGHRPDANAMIRDLARRVCSCVLPALQGLEEKIQYTGRVCTRGHGAGHDEPQFERAGFRFAHGHPP